MNFTYENQGTNTYLVYNVKADDGLDYTSLGMITNNKIPGLTDALFTQMNEDRYVKYNVSSQITAKRFLHGQVNRKRLLSVLKGVADTMMTAPVDYLIKSDEILLDLEYIFVDVRSYEVNMVCLPITNLNSNVSLYDFIKNIVYSTQLDQSENTGYFSKISNFLNESPDFSIFSFKQFVDGLLSESVTDSPVKPVEYPVVDPVIEPVVPPVVKQVVTPEVKPIVESIAKPVVNPVVKPDSEEKKDEKKKSFFGFFHHDKKDKDDVPAKKEKVDEIPGGFAIPGMETSPVEYATPSSADAVSGGVNTKSNDVKHNPVVVPIEPNVKEPVIEPINETPSGVASSVFFDFDEDEGTVVMGSTSSELSFNPYLIRESTGEKIFITEKEFYIGRNSELNHYNISGNEYVGHCHCHIVVADRECYVVDDNSKNHTYIDGKMLTASTMFAIKHGQTLTIASEKFEFCTY